MGYICCMRITIKKYYIYHSKHTWSYACVHAHMHCVGGSWGAKRKSHNREIENWFSILALQIHREFFTHTHTHTHTHCTHTFFFVDKELILYISLVDRELILMISLVDKKKLILNTSLVDR